MYVHPPLQLPRGVRLLHICDLRHNTQRDRRSCALGKGGQVMSQRHRAAFVLLVMAALVLACAAPAFARGRFPSEAIAIDGTDLYEARATPKVAAAESSLPTPPIDPQILADHGEPTIGSPSPSCGASGRARLPSCKSPCALRL